ncbi:MsnO8 family LLM class oxidoreductase [Miniimonas sp. S16]|uniref:MsnO8 family LLM class oxidoreductase n=1 Tax=Miniimonas sp. S16 TaxID=2171623 RepID=UPI001F20AEF2|nr:MsnO8 family LLM class oxidoreductase [Miniimonas sp. S16]
MLDLIPVRTGQTTSQALSASAALARLADDAGYTRFWVAEHHNMPAVASTVPGVLIAYLAQGTHRIRFGSGGVMLPNHTALAIAEQFALLEAMLPGRVDLGIGRAPGSDPVTAYLLRGGQQPEDAFVQDVTLARELLGGGDAAAGDAVALSIGGRPFAVRPTPLATSGPTLWLLGSSGFSADLAARLGLPYVFANHFGMPGLADALARYRTAYQPSAAHPEPTSLLPVNVVVARTTAQAEAWAGPQLVQMVRLRTGAPLLPQLTVEEAAAYPWTEAEASIRDAVRAHWFVGAVSDVVPRLASAAADAGVDEVMVVPAAGASAEDALDAAPGRAETLTLLAEALLG